MIERWRDVSEFDGYQVSDRGNVRGVDRLDARWRFRPGKTLAQYEQNGTRFVTLYVGGKRRGRSVAQLVARAFVPNPNNAYHVAHKDGDQRNNAAENLEWRERK